MIPSGVIAFLRIIFSYSLRLSKISKISISPSVTLNLIQDGAALKVFSKKK
jgi:hypothetical protein